MKNFKYAVMVIIMLSAFTVTANGENWQQQTITPTDNYYLAKVIDESLVSMYNLTERFDKKRISNNLRPRNVYQKAVTVAAEFNLIHENTLNQAKLADANNLDASKSTPGDVFGVLSLIKEYLVSQNKFAETKEDKTLKTPNDVFQMLRQISAHHNEIAKKKNIVTNWATPAQVYDALANNILPVIEGIADELSLEYEPFSFPKQPVTGVVPRNTYSLLYYIYTNISQYYMNKGGYEPIILELVNDCDDVSAGDVFDLATIIASEMKVRSGNKTMNQNSKVFYAKWKEEKEKVVPGDVFRLLQHNFVLTRRILEKAD